MERPQMESTLMIWLVRAFAPLRFDEEGQTLVEYALILLLVSTAAVGLLSALGWIFAVGVAWVLVGLWRRRGA